MRNHILEIFRKVKVVIDIATLPDFASKSKKVRVATPRRISNPEQIVFGNNIFIGHNSTIAAIDTRKSRTDDVKIKIGSNVEATGALQIHAISSVIIDSDVLIATNVFITDCSHGYEHPGVPYKDQELSSIAPVHIKKGCWIGQNVVILQGVSIGEYSIIGANSVVTKSIPDRCIAVGSPAKPVKKWSEEKQAWVKFYG